MVSARKLMQMLHCKRTYRTRARARSSHSEEQRPTTSTPRKVFPSKKKIKREAIRIKKERKDGTHTVCRVCLQEGHIPILGNDHYCDVSEDLNTFTGVDVKANDEHPKHMCENCYSQLQGAIQLRFTAQYSQQVLLDQINYHDDTHDDVHNNDNDTHHSMNDDDDDDDTHYRSSTRRERNEPEKFHCRKCMIYFDNEKAFHDHRLSEEHEKLKKPCPVCCKVYDATYLRAHLKYHSAKILEVCDVCGKEFTVRGHFIQHRKIHTHELPYKCTWCPYRCRFNYALTVHMRTHTGEKPYQCEHCPEKSFINKSNLNRHLLTHKTGHDFICDMCQRGFYHKTDLENHFKADHMGIKDHICDICDKAFGLRTQLMKHKLKVHRRERLRSGRVPLYLRAEYQKDGADMENNENQQFTS